MIAVARLDDDDSDLQIAAAYLSRVAEPASLPLWMFVREVGYLEAAQRIRDGAVSADVAQVTEARRRTVAAEDDLDAASRHHTRLITPSSGEWPHFAFAALEAAGERRTYEWRAGLRRRPERGEPIPPLALWIRGNGDLTGVGVRSVAIVGSRAATAYGQHAATEIAFGLARRDVVVVSGGAYGIDAAAHRGALAADGVSVLVSAGGLDRPYPAGNKHLYDRTCEQGLLISERPPGSAPHRQRFLSRNRLIAALGSATLVVEAARRSGALNSAGYARDLGRPVLAVPGPITSAMSVGCHLQLQRDDEPARLVTSVEDVLDYCGSLTELNHGPQQLEVVSAYDSLDHSARAVLDGFPRRQWVTESDLARLSGRPIHEVVAALPGLRRLGLISMSREGYRLVAGVAS